MHDPLTASVIFNRLSLALFGYQKGGTIVVVDTVASDAVLLACLTSSGGLLFGGAGKICRVVFHKTVREVRAMLLLRLNLH